MKKIFKKSIAMLIAVLMVISTMPFTALTASAADSTAKAYVKANIASFDGYTGTAKYTYNGTDLSSSDPSYYSNLLYDDGKFNDTTQQVSDNSVCAKIYINNNVVMLYDGTNSTILPVVVRTWKTSINSLTGRKYLHEISMEDATSLKSWSLQQDWTGGKGDSLGWPTGTSTVYYNKFDMDTSIEFDGQNTGYVWKNKLYYQGPQNQNATYYEKLNSNITMIVHHTQWGISESERKLTLSNTNANIYVVNYKPIKKAIATMKSVYNTIQSNGEDKYCDDYLENFYQAAYQIMTFNPNTDYSDTENAVKNVADKISDLVSNAVPTATTEPTKHTEETIPAVAATCSTTGLTEGKKCSHCGEILVAQQEVPATGKHTPGEATRENEVAATCGKDGSYDEVIRCTVCDTELSRTKITVPATGKHNIVDGKCTVCGYVAYSLEAYNKAVDEAILIMAETDKYTADSMQAYKDAYSAATAKISGVKTQAEVDAITSEIISAQTLLVASKVTITFRVENEDGDVVTAVTTADYDYGTAVDFDSKSDSVIKWIVKNSLANDTKISTTDSVLSYIPTEDATLIAVVSTDKDESADVYSKVTFLGKNNKVVAIKYVKLGEKLETNKVEIPSIPFYTASAWDTAEVVADGSDFVVKAEYKFVESDDDKCGVHFNGNVKQYAYDSYVYLFDADENQQYALADENGNIYTYLDGVDFYAPHIKDIYVIAVDSAEAKIGITGSYKYSGDSKRGAAFNIKFWLPEGATAVEWGLEYSAQTASGKKTAKLPVKTATTRNEFTAKVTVPEASSVKEFEGRAYLRYKDADGLHTIYSDTVTQNIEL